MTETRPATAETISGFVLWITGIGATYWGAHISGALCFVTVGLIACARSYAKTHE